MLSRNGSASPHAGPTWQSERALGLVVCFLSVDAGGISRDLVTRVHGGLCLSGLSISGKAIIVVHHHELQVLLCRLTAVVVVEYLPKIYILPLAPNTHHIRLQ